MQIVLKCRENYETEDFADERTITSDVKQEQCWPDCSWCHMKTLQPVADLVMVSQKTQHVHTACLCQNCNKSTIVVYDWPKGEKLPWFPHGYKKVRSW